MQHFLAWEKKQIGEQRLPQGHVALRRDVAAAAEPVEREELEQATGSRASEQIKMKDLPNSVSLDEGDGGDGKQERGLIQRLASAVVALLSPHKAVHTMGRFLSLRAIRLAIFFTIGLCMSFLGHFGARRSTTSSRQPQEVIYSDFLTMVGSGNVRAVRFEEGTGRVLFDVKNTLKEQQKSDLDRRPTKRVPRQFYTRHLPDPQLITMLRDNQVEFGTVKAALGNTFSKILVTTLALWIPLLPMFIIMRRFLEGRNGASRKKKKSAGQGTPRVRFTDVAGVDVAKQELEEVVACLRDSSKFTRVGAKLPSGVLLCGPPGTGKTLLAKAVAGEANVPFLSVSASEFVELFVGRGAARIRELFAEARKRSPCVIFIDELDAIGGKRGAGLNEERDQTLNQLLTELDGFEGRPGIVLLAATNRAEVLDPALLRPGRLSRKVNVPLPDLQGRTDILVVHLKNIPVEGGAQGVAQAAEVVARLSAGFSGADLANVVNEAAFLAARRDADVVSLDDLGEAVLRTRFGVNGAQTELPSWSKSFRKWMAAQIQRQSPVRSQPLGS